MILLVAGVLALPLVGALISGLFGRRNDRVQYWSTLAASALTTACALGLLAYGDRHVSLPVEWLPGFGVWSLHIGGVGLWAAVTTTASAFLVYLIARGERDTRSPFTDTVILTALSASNAAFLMGHFLGRYVALEIVALCVAAALLTESADRQDISSAGRVYLVLRIGDAGLLAAILILLDAAGSLDIDAALSVGVTLEGSLRVWTAAGFALACWVKLGVWPFHQWLDGGRALRLPARGWLFATVMPQLGLYLLYRVSPLLVGGMVGALVTMLGLVSVLMAVVLAVLRVPEDPGSLVVYGSAVVGGIAIVLGAAGARTMLAGLLIAAAPVRALAWWAGSALGVETDVLEGGLNKMLRDVVRNAKILHDLVEVGVFHEGATRIAHATMRLAEILHRRVEEGGLDRIPVVVSRGALRGAGWFRRRHSGRLRHSLMWIVLSLLAALLIVVTVW